MKLRIIFLILIIAMTAVFSACQKKPNNIVNQPENNAVLEDPNEVGTTTEEIDTSDWQIYRNEEYGFELNYPKGVIIKEYKHATRPNIIFQNEKIYFEVALISKYNVNLNNYFYLDYSPVGKEKINEREFLIFKSETGYCDGPGCGYPFIAYSTKSNEIFYNLVFYKTTKLNKDTEKILRSFEFLSK